MRDREESSPLAKERPSRFAAPMRFVWRCVLGLAAIWSVALSAIFAIQQARPTPKKFISFVAEHPLAGLDAAGRTAVIERAANLLNGLSFEQRQELKETESLRTFFTQMTADERSRFIARTVPESFHQLIAALNKMAPAERKRLVQRTLRNLRTHGSEAALLSGDEEIRQMLSQGFATFSNEADPEVKLDFAPLIEEVQARLATQRGTPAGKP